MQQQNPTEISKSSLEFQVNSGKVVSQGLNDPPEKAIEVELLLQDEKDYQINLDQDLDLCKIRIRQVSNLLTLQETIDKLNKKIEKVSKKKWEFKGVSLKGVDQQINNDTLKFKLYLLLNELSSFQMSFKLVK